ncbi:hypothetical protein, partial [Collinsella sp. An2]|uniref:hypothetical protein n=1 Tax=Collinsella sp. An2 TaxID=1965585 RepID=UPI001951D717
PYVRYGGTAGDDYKAIVPAQPATRYAAGRLSLNGFLISSRCEPPMHPARFPMPRAYGRERTLFRGNLHARVCIPSYMYAIHTLKALYKGCFRVDCRRTRTKRVNCHKTSETQQQNRRRSMKRTIKSYNSDCSFRFYAVNSGFHK